MGGFLEFVVFAGRHWRSLLGFLGLGILAASLVNLVQPRVYQATAVSYVRAWHRYPDPERPDMVLWGEYHDRWERIADTWRIRERRVLEAGIEPRRDGGVPNPRRASR